MKATVQDRAALSALPPLEVAAYLRSNGWKQVRRIGERATIWTRPAGKEEFELTLPMTRDVGDFVPRMAEVMTVLEAAEQRSQLEILRDLTNTTADIIRIRARQLDADDGTIPLADGVELVEAACEMILASACATVQPRSHFATRKPTRAVQYMEGIRLGQTERGSYVVTLVSRVPPKIEPRADGQEALDIEDPFERRVTLTLASALSAIPEAVADLAATGSFDSFQKAVRRGVSANLCDAIALMAGHGSRPRELRIDLTWSRIRPVEATAPQGITISADAARFIREAGRFFRETSPRDDFELVGLVTDLKSTDPTQEGRIAVLGLVDGAARRVSLPLEGADYDLAIQAHRAIRAIRCQGRLVKRGKLLEMEDPHEFEMLTDDAP